MDLGRLRVLHRIGFACAALWLGGAPPPASSEPILHLVDEAVNGIVEANGIDAELLDQIRERGLSQKEWTAVFAVYTGATSAIGSDQPPIAGSWTIAEDGLRFHSRYPWVADLTYSARFDVAQLRRLVAGVTSEEAPITASFALPATAMKPTTQVTQVFPTASTLPENLLRLYVQFSRPMSRGESTQRIRLLDGQGQIVDRPFLEVGEELWDPRMRRMTVFFDPGRIKRGLRPHDEAGPPLRAGESYRLVIDAAWRDSDGLPLVKGFEKAFTVTEPDREALDPTQWQLETPTVETREPLELRFPKPLDHGLLHRVIRFQHSNGEPVGGEIEITEQEMTLRFTPQELWQPGGYAIEVEAILEDVAGNNLKQVFDLEVEAPKPAAADQDTILIPFRIETR